MDFVLAGGDGKGLAAVRRNQKQLGGLFFFAVFSFAVFRIGIFALGNFALREKRDPLAVGRPLRRGVMTGLRQRRQTAAPAVR